jgi:small subunit ribosomal protein S17
MATTPTKKTTKAAPKTASQAAGQSGKIQASAAAEGHEARAAHTKKLAVGTVVSNKMQKTIVVKVDRRVRHGMYGKYIVKSRRFKAHDEKNEAKMGDRVEIIESRPLSRDKRWVLRSIVRRAGQALELNVE